jgi:crossover junction endodeoxyribonuclease RusA
MTGQATREAHQRACRGHELDVPLHHGALPLSGNDRLNRWEKARRVATVREAVGWAAKAARIPTAAHIEVRLHYQPGDRRNRDWSNCWPTQKAAVDGLRDAGVVADDDAAHVTEHMPVIHPGRGERRLWLWVMPTELREEDTR